MTDSGIVRVELFEPNTFRPRDPMKKTLSIKQKICLLVLGISANACVIEPVDESEFSATESKEQSVSSWQMYGDGKNLNSFDVGAGWGCFENPDSSGNFIITCALGGEALGPRVAASTWMGNLPNGIKGPSSSKARAKSIAVSVPIMGAAVLYVLGRDNVVRASSGRLEMKEPWLDRKAFQSFGVSVKAETTSGTPLVIKEIASIGLPSHYGASQLIALASDGYVYLKSASQWRRVDANSPAPFNAIPNNKFREISRGSKLGGYLLDDATSRVFLVGAGTYDHQNFIAHYDNRWLPSLPNGLLAANVGGPFVLTNAGDGSCAVGATSCPGDDKRVYQFNLSTNTWVKPSGALVPAPVLTPPKTPNDPYSTTAPWKGIADGDGAGASYFVWHFYTRLYKASP